jgi:RND family efflux transporter MFP subunit
MTVGDRTQASPTILIGEVRSRYESAQGFRIAGKIIKRYVDIGNRVTKNQLIAKLDNQDTGLTTKAAQAQVLAAEADLALAKAELARHQQLYQRNFISKQALEIQEAKQQSAAALVKQSRAQAAVSNNQSIYTDLLAEQDGVITEIRAEPGQVVAAGEVITRIAALDTLEVAIDIPESRMQGIAIDTPAEIRLWADPSRQYQGKVREVAAAADSVTRTFQVRVALPATDDQVRLGMFREDGVIITEGIQTGEQVVSAGVQTLVPGQIVRPITMQSSQ